jgi:hypothetical protein
VKSPTQSEPSIFQGHVAEIEAFGKSPDKRVHRFFGIRHFADLGDKRSGTLHIAKSRREIPTVRLLGHVAAIIEIGKSPERKHAIGKSAIGDSRSQKHSTSELAKSRVAKSRFAISRYDLDRPIINRSGPLKSPKGKFFAFRHFERKRTGKARNTLTFTRVVTCEGDQRPNSSPISSHWPSANRRF